MELKREKRKMIGPCGESKPVRISYCRKSYADTKKRKKSTKKNKTTKKTTKRKRNKGLTTAEFASKMEENQRKATARETKLYKKVEMQTLRNKRRGADRALGRRIAGGGGTTIPKTPTRIPGAALKRWRAGNRG